MKVFLRFFFILIVLGMFSCSNENTPDATINVPNSSLSYKINGQLFIYNYPSDFIIANLEVDDFLHEARIRISASDLNWPTSITRDLNIEDISYPLTGYWDLPPTRLYTSVAGAAITTSLIINGQSFSNEGLVNNGYYTNVNITRIDSIAGYYSMGNVRITGSFSAKVRREPIGGSAQDLEITEGYFNDVLLVRD